MQIMNNNIELLIQTLKFFIPIPHYKISAVQSLLKTRSIYSKKPAPVIPTYYERGKILQFHSDKS